MAVTESAPETAPAMPEVAGARATQENVGARAAHEGILRRQAARESAARTYARALPIVPVRARGLTIEGADGNRYLDCLSGAGTLALGHNHPVVLEAIRKVLDSGAPLQVLDLATPVKDAFTTELFRTLPPGLADHARVQFCGPAGTDAVEAALKLVRAATGRSGILAFVGAYHGMTAGPLAASGGASDVRVARSPYPQDYRCPFGVGGEPGAELAARWTESILDDTKSGVPSPAGMILEPVQGEGEVIPARDDWMRRMRRDHLGALHPADRRRGPDGSRADRRLLGGGAQRHHTRCDGPLQGHRGAACRWRSSSTARTSTCGNRAPTRARSAATSSPWPRAPRLSRTSVRTASPSEPRFWAPA